MSSDSFLVDGFLAMESSHSPVLEDFFGLESPLMTVCSAVSSSSSQDKSFLADDDVSSLIVSSSLSRLLGFLPLSNRSERLISVLPPFVFPTKSVRSITRSSSSKAPPLPTSSVFCIPFLVFGAATFMSSPVSFSSIVAGRGSSDGDSSQKKAVIVRKEFTKSVPRTAETRAHGAFLAPDSNTENIIQQKNVFKLEFRPTSSLSGCTCRAAATSARPGNASASTNGTDIRITLSGHPASRLLLSHLKRSSRSYDCTDCEYRGKAKHFQ
ncbi:hypothetical protein PsorP6_000803 [Peronosclerospora sorghi]|uniref:Uncharacterized protein n=1 Tax=Peronosclerospora sorghi TaxID=230839 RepID=A0ACC0WS78_9STRA|nr:hypothetical protein PsorP6_000803 [Peronosclerospora sorghi]